MPVGLIPMRVAMLWPLLRHEDFPKYAAAHAYCCVAVNVVKIDDELLNILCYYREPNTKVKKWMGCVVWENNTLIYHTITNQTIQQQQINTLNLCFDNIPQLSHTSPTTRIIYRQSNQKVFILLRMLQVCSITHGYATIIRLLPEKPTNTIQSTMKQLIWWLHCITVIQMMKLSVSV